MNTPTALRSAGRINYAVLRVPLRVVDEQVVQRCLPHDSIARRSFEQALDSLDEVAGRWLREPEQADESPVADEAPARDEPVGDADADAGGSNEPVESDELVESDQAAESDKSDKLVEPDEEEQIERLTDELLEEQQSETFAGELAEDDELRQVQAELNAKRLVEEQRDDQG